MSTNLNIKLKYIHCRNIKDGSVMGKGGMTIAYAVNQDNKVLGYAGAKCHSNDNYNKKIGRAKATGRMKSATYYQECPELDEKTFINSTLTGYQKAFNE